MRSLIFLFFTFFALPLYAQDIHLGLLRLQNDPRFDEDFTYARIELRAQGDVLAAWSDGGFDVAAGGTAAYIISVYRGGKWHCLQLGGVYDRTILSNDSFRMEAIGMESLIDNLYDYICEI